MRKLLLFLFLALPAFASFPAGTVWEVQPTSGVDTNGGCFMGGGTDLTYPTSAPVAYTDLVAVTATTITSVATPFSAASVGNCLHIASGTGWTAGWYYIVSVSVVTATVDKAIATMGSVGGTGTLGGAIKTLTQLNTNMNLTLNISNAWVKSEATITTGASIVFSFTSLGTSMSGYTTTRGDAGKVTVQATAGSFSIFNIVPGNNAFVVRNFILDCNAQTACTGYLQTNAFQEADNVAVINFKNGAFNINNVGFYCNGCYATGGSGTVAAFANGTNDSFTCRFCVAVSNSVVGFASQSITCIFCIAGNNSGATTDGFIFAGQSRPVICDHCIAYGNGRDGIRFSGTLGSNPFSVTNSILVNNTAYGLNSSGLVIPPFNDTLNWNAYFGNGTAAINQFTAGQNDITLTGSPFVNGGSNNFALNSTAGAGASVKALSFPVTLYIGGTNAEDIGALQSAGGPTSVTVGYPIQ